MTAKEKANELVNAMFNTGNCMMQEDAIQCALIVVEEIIMANPSEYVNNPLGNSNNKITNICKKSYWQEVKQEIEKL